MKALITRSRIAIKALTSKNHLILAQKALMDKLEDKVLVEILNQNKNLRYLPGK